MHDELDLCKRRFLADMSTCFLYFLHNSLRASALRFLPRSHPFLVWCFPASFPAQVMMALSSEPPQWLRPSGVPMRLSQSMDSHSQQPMPAFGAPHAQPPPHAPPFWAHPQNSNTPRSLSWEPSDGYESTHSDREPGGAGSLMAPRVYPGMPGSGVPVGMPGGAISGAAVPGLGMPSVPENPELLAWSQLHSVHYQQHQQQQYQHHPHFQQQQQQQRYHQQQQMLQAQQMRTFSQHQMAPLQLEPLQDNWSHSTGGQAEPMRGRNFSTAESSALAEALSNQSTAQGAPSEVGDSQSQSGQSMASTSLYMRKLDQLQQQQQQLLMLLLQQQRLRPALVSQLYGGHPPGAPPFSALPQIGEVPQTQHTQQAHLAPGPEARPRAGGPFWGAFGAHSVAPGAYPATEQQRPMGPGHAGLEHQQEVWRGDVNGTTSRQQSRTAGFQPGGFHGSPAADALARAGLGIAPQQQAQMGQEGTPSNPGSWLDVDRVQEGRMQRSLGRGQGGLHEDEQDENGSISTCSVHCSSEEDGTLT